MSRRQARENALQILYMADNCRLPIEEAIKSFKDCFSKEQEYRDFEYSILEGVEKNKTLIDSLICQYAKNWDLSRMAVIDRNILRIALFEIIYMPLTPINVIIDEAVEISKIYSTKDSSKFVNGILDKMQTERAKNEG
ncbi:MAG: transcription antitermination factor NusB [Elusimicrobiota bacterium]|jgi:N utilization substance protein B|nr:transcription antitermination factor NusB [Elusimicrobiota bacterium]